MVPHLWHAMQGAITYGCLAISIRMYGQINSITDCLLGNRPRRMETWTASRGNQGGMRAVAASHRGLMLYQGEDSPMVIAGRRFLPISMAIVLITVLPSGSGCGVASARFLFMNDRMSMGIAPAAPMAGLLQTGTTAMSATRNKPDRTTGRVYKITYKTEPIAKFARRCAKLVGFRHRTTVLRPPRPADFAGRGPAGGA